MEISILLIDDARSAVEYVAAIWTSRIPFGSPVDRCAENNGEDRPAPEHAPRRHQAVILWDELLGCGRARPRDRRTGVADRPIRTR